MYVTPYAINDNNENILKITFKNEGFKSPLRAGERALWVTSLLYKPDELGPGLQTQEKAGHRGAREVGGREAPGPQGRSLGTHISG